MEGGEQKPAGDADALLNVIVFDFAVTVEAIIDAEYDDKIWTDVEEGFFPVGSEGGQGVEPFLGEATFVVLALFGFGGKADLMLDFCVANYNKTPRLLVCTARGGGGRRDGVFDEFEGNRLGAEVADGAALGHDLAEFEGASALSRGIEAIKVERNEFGHGC